MIVQEMEGGITTPSGFSCSASKGGLRKSGRNDIAILFSEKKCSAAAVFTTNRLKAACVLVTAKHLSESGGRMHGAVINSGNANALTGEEGLRNAVRMAETAAAELNVSPAEMAVCSTGIIGVQLPIDRVVEGIRKAATALSTSREAATLAAEAIMTTDRRIKESALTLTLSDGRKVSIGGMTKGSGMISPSMAALHATTLTFITTDAPVSQQYLQSCLESCTRRTFNMISVDADQSTNDTILALANGAAGGPAITADPAFEKGLEKVMWQLARMVAMDGEGETKLLTVTVEGAASEEDASAAALSVVKSNLVKCAVFGSDPNVGRIASAIGNSGATVDFGKLDVSIGPEGEVPVIAGGLVTGNAGEAAHLMSGREVFVVVRLNMGVFSSRAMGCDLTYEYVRINSAYST